METPIATHHFNFAPKENGGESLTLSTEFFDNGDYAAGLGESGIFTNQSLTLQSYGNSASINLCGIQLTPEILRKLADELDEKKGQVKADLDKLRLSTKS